MNEMIPIGGKFRANRNSQGSENRRSLNLDVRTGNSSIYLTEHEYGGRSICPTMDDLRWLRDVLNRMEFCDHDFQKRPQKPGWTEYTGPPECIRCGQWYYGPSEETLEFHEEE